MAQQILVLGANGHVGRPLVQALLQRGESVRAASQSGLGVAGVTPVRLDYQDPQSITAALENVDRLFLMLPTGYVNIFEMLEPVTRAAIERGIKVVYQSVLGVDADDSIPYRRIELLLQNSGVPHVILRPNWFMDNFTSFWLEGIRHNCIAIPAADGQSSLIDARDIADCAAVALTSSAFDGQALNLTGPAAVGYAEAAARISATIGREVRYNPISADAFVAMLTSAGVNADYAGFLASIFYPVTMGWTAAVTDAVTRMTGKPARTLDAYLQDYQAVLASQS